MKQLVKRVNQLESTMNAGAKHITIERLIIHTTEQLEHPERFIKKLISSEPGKDCTRNVYALEN